MPDATAPHDRDPAAIERPAIKAWPPAGEAPIPDVEVSRQNVATERYSETDCELGCGLGQQVRYDREPNAAVRAGFNIEVVKTLQRARDDPQSRACIEQ
jgi:hypothetical protein